MAPKNQTEMIKNPPVASSTEEEEEESGSSDDDDQISDSSVAAKNVGTETDGELSEPVKFKSSDMAPPESSTAKISLDKPTKKKVAPLKRHHEADSKGESDSEPAKKKMKPDNKLSDETGKKSLIQRIFTEEDEVALLKGILMFISKGGDLSHNMNGFCDDIKSKISFNASKDQLSNKVKRMKNKFDKAVISSLKKGKGGEDHIMFSKHSNQEVFDLSRKIWGSNGVLACKSRMMLGGENSKEEISKREVEKSEIVSYILAENATSMTFDESTLHASWDMVAEGSEKRGAEIKIKKIKAFQAELRVMWSRIVAEATKLIFKDHASSSGGI